MKILEQKLSYKLRKKISTGGTGIIYSAVKIDSEGRTDGLRYAVKELNDTLAHTLAEKEKNCSQKIENESRYSVVIPILDSIRINQQQYLIMQLKHQGLFLNELIREIHGSIPEGSIMPFRHVIGIMSAVLTALEHLHNCMPDDADSRGFLHLDLHPGNIFLENADWKNNQYGTVKFIDLQNAVEIKQNGYAWIGPENKPLGITKGFCAPELAERRFEDISMSTDLYSAAAICLYMLLGKFTNFRLSYVDYLYDELDEILSKMNLVSAAQYCLKCFLKQGLDNQINRFQDAAEMQESLDFIWKLQKFYDSENYYTLLQAAYHNNIRQNQFQICQTVSKKGFSDAVHKLSRALMQDKKDVLECRHIYRGLISLYQEHADAADPPILADLYKSGLAIYNHLADTKSLMEISDRLLELKPHLKIMDLASIINRTAVHYADVFWTDKALRYTAENIQNLEKIKKAYLSIASKENLPDESAELLDLGRAYSACGTYLAYEGKNECMHYFKKALHEFRLNRANTSITISHILHYAVEKDFDLFNEWYLQLTGGVPLEERDEIQNFINAEKNQKDIYSLWIYIKAVYLFSRQDSIPYLQKRILDLLKHKDFYSENQHPQALILKYCGLLLYQTGEEAYQAQAVRAFQKAVQRLNGKLKIDAGELTLFKIMSYHIQSEQLIVMKNNEDAACLYSRFMDRLEDSIYYRLKDWLDIYNKNRKVPKIALKGEYC